MRGRPPCGSRSMVGADSDPSLTADEAGQLAMMLQIVTHRVWRGRGLSAAVRVGRVRLAPGDASVLSRPAADPDRGAGLEPLGGTARSLTAAAALGATLGLYLLRRLPDRRRTAGVVARLSRAARAPGRRQRIDDARMVSGRPPGAVGGDHRRRAGDRRDPQFRNRQGKLPGRIARRLRARHPGPAARARRSRPASTSERWSTSWWQRSRRRPRCSRPSSACSICGSRAASCASPAGCGDRGRTCPRSHSRRRRSALLAVAIAGTFLPGLVGHPSARIAAASLFMAYAILGFAVLHATHARLELSAPCC